MSLNNTHKALIRESLRRPNTAEPANRKRRKATPVPAETIDLDSESTDDFEDVDLEDVDLEAIAGTRGGSANAPPIPESGNNSEMSKDASGVSDSEEDSDDFDDLEDVDMDIFNEPTNDDNRNETLTFSIDNRPKETRESKKKRTFVPISKEERKYRKLVHKLVLFTMVCHGAVRNKWCSDQRLSKLRKLVSAEIINLFYQDSADVLDYVKAKRFIDGLRKLSAVFSKRFRVTTPGIQRRNWGNETNNEVSIALSFDKFAKSVKTFQGSRDLGAQAFVAILRAMGVDCRLVFSVQVPDYRSIIPAKEEHEKGETAPKSKPKSEFDPVFIPNPRQALLAGIRSKKKQEAKVKPTNTSNFPVFWIEVWNKYSKKWITVDPVVFKVVEVVPMRRKCKFDAPASDETHQTWYVIAYDKYGTVKDVTRRYTQYYNAKTAKRRIGFSSEEDEHWYSRMLRAVSRKKPSITQAEAVELKEFYDRHICEGTPNNMADFKNHPVYALEPQLRQDEIIYPKDETSKCGTFRSSSKSSIMPVYKRSCVYKLKTPKAWHMNGRTIKVGAQPLKTKKAMAQLGEEDDDDEVRLYAEFQTELYRPPPVVDGKITKNAYGNVEIFTPSMVPENGYLVPVSGAVSMKMLETAARWILNIDYAKAIVSFEFGNGQKNKRAPTAKEGGILIDAQYKDGMSAVLEGLQEQEEQEKREAVELNALRSWNFFLKKLQIIKRLDRNHGKLDEEESRGVEKQEDEDDGYFSVASEDEISNNENSDNDVYVPRPSRRSKSRNVPSDEEASEDNIGGGFLLENSVRDDHDNSTEGGFFNPVNQAEDGPEDSDSGGGFFIEPEAKSSDQTNLSQDREPNPESTPELILAHSGSEADARSIPPKRKRYPRPSSDANIMHDPGSEAIAVDSGSEDQELPEMEEYSEKEPNKNQSRSTRAGRARTAVVSYAENGNDTHDEEEELGIEYSDSD